MIYNEIKQCYTYYKLSINLNLFFVLFFVFWPLLFLEANKNLLTRQQVHVYTSIISLINQQYPSTLFLKSRHYLLHRFDSLPSNDFPRVNSNPSFRLREHTTTPLSSQKSNFADNVWQMLICVLTLRFELINHLC